MQKLDSFSTMRERCYRIDWFKIVLFSLIFYLIGIQFFKSGSANEGQSNFLKKEELEDLIKDKRLILESNKSLKGSFVKENIQKASVLSFVDLQFGGDKIKSRRSALFDLQGKEIKAFIKRFVHVAMNEQKKYGVPTSIILANSLLQSDAGSRKLTKKLNNYFAIYCGSRYAGNKHEDENCVRAYDNAWSSFRDHSLYLTKELQLSKLEGKDYKTWAKALQASEKFDTKDLENNLIKVIEQLELYRFDE